MSDIHDLWTREVDGLQLRKIFLTVFQNRVSLKATETIGHPVDITCFSALTPEEVILIAAKMIRVMLPYVKDCGILSETMVMLSADAIQKLSEEEKHEAQSTHMLPQ